MAVYVILTVGCRHAGVRRDGGEDVPDAHNQRGHELPDVRGRGEAQAHGGGARCRVRAALRDRHGRVGAGPDDQRAPHGRPGYQPILHRGLRLLSRQRIACPVPEAPSHRGATLLGRDHFSLLFARNALTPEE